MKKAQKLVRNHITTKYSIEVLVLCRKLKNKLEKTVKVRQSKNTQIGVMIYSI